MAESGYDVSASTFSPNGSILQVEYATKAVDKSSTIIGIRGIDSVVLAYKKPPIGKLYTEDTAGRIFTVESHIGMAVAGLVADGNLVVEMARQEARHFRNQFKEVISMEGMCERIASFVQVHTMYSAVRPFGLSVLLASWSEKCGPELFKIDPDGSLIGYYGLACGLTAKQAKEDIEGYPIGLMPTEELAIAVGEVVYRNQARYQKDFALNMSVVGKDTSGEHKINPEPWIGMATTAGKSAVGEIIKKTPLKSSTSSESE